MTMTSSSRPVPYGLPKLGIAVLMTFLMILSAVLMHTLMGHTAHGDAMPAMSETTTAGSMNTEHLAGHGAAAASSDAGHHAMSSITAAAATLSSGVSDCGGLCAMIWSLMGMACLMVLVLFAIGWLRARTSRALFVVSKALATAPTWARGIIPRRPVSLTALSVIRI